MPKRNTPNIVNVCRRLDENYGSPTHGNKLNPLDELIYIILSTRTRDPSFQSTYRRLKREFPTWKAITPKKRRHVYKILEPGGLGKLKTSQIIDILAAITKRFGHATLAPLREMEDSEIENYLTSLPGVAKKIAKCVMMYSFKRQVLPVDVHVHRISQRLGLNVKRRPDTSQDMLEKVVPPRLRYGFHVNAVAHGRAVCLPNNPKCEQCCIRSQCNFPKRPYRAEKVRRRA